MSIQIVAIIVLMFFVVISLFLNIKQIDDRAKLNKELGNTTKEYVKIFDENLKLKEEIAKKPKKQDSKELQEFLADLFQGGGLVRVERIDPTSLFIHNPKGYH